MTSCPVCALPVGPKSAGGSRIVDLVYLLLQPIHFLYCLFLCFVWNPSVNDNTCFHPKHEHNAVFQMLFSKNSRTLAEHQTCWNKWGITENGSAHLTQSSRLSLWTPPLKPLAMIYLLLYNAAWSENFALWWPPFGCLTYYRWIQIKKTDVFMCRISNQGAVFTFLCWQMLASGLTWDFSLTITL